MAPEMTPAVARISRRRNARRLILRLPLSSFYAGAYLRMPKPIKHFEREVRRARHLSAWIKVQDRTIAECHVMDISKNGAKILTATPSVVPDRFQLAFFEGGQTRTCEVIWRHGKVLGVKFDAQPEPASNPC
jgi:hypothetical protein